jgi:phosphoserine phosphatase
MNKLIVFDMDGVIFQAKNFWLELHKVFNTFKEGKELTEKYLHSDYQKLVEEVVHRLWKGKDAQPYFNLINSTKYFPGIKKVFDYIKSQNLLVAIISSGPIDLARKAQHDLGVDFIYANELVIKNNKIVGEFIWPVGGEPKKKAQIVNNLCKDLGIKTEEVVYIGDSLVDLEAFKIVGTSIAFNSKNKELKEIATHIVEEYDLSKIIPLLSL